MHGRIRWLASGVPKKAPARDLRMPTSPAWGRTQHESDGGRDRPVSPPPDRAQAPREASGKVSRVEYIIEDEETCGAGGNATTGEMRTGATHLGLTVGSHRFLRRRGQSFGWHRHAKHTREAITRT